ncbi:MAG: DoxX family protein [Candidatus Methylomirabilales bacterium]
MSEARGYGVTVLRVTLGGIFLMHGYLGGFVFTPEGLTQFNAKVGVPLPQLAAWFVILGHFVGGAFLLLGVFTRIGALIHVIIMAGAVLFVHIGQGFFLHGLEQGRYGGYEYALVLLLASVAILLLGGGPFAFDDWRR